MPRKQPKRGKSQRRLVEELPELLEERNLSVRALAIKAEVSASHLGRVLHKQDYKTPSAELSRRVARALDLPDDYWPEYRERIVIDKVRSDPELREVLYSRLSREEKR